MKRHAEQVALAGLKAKWETLVSLAQKSVNELNAMNELPLQEPIALFRLDGPFAFEITKPGKLEVVGSAHLNSSTDSIELKIFRRSGALDYPPFKSRTFYIALPKLIDPSRHWALRSSYSFGPMYMTTRPSQA